MKFPIVTMKLSGVKNQDLGKFCETRIKDSSFLPVLRTDNNNGEVNFSESRLIIKHSRTTVTRCERNFTDYDKFYYHNLVWIAFQ